MSQPRRLKRIAVNFLLAFSVLFVILPLIGMQTTNLGAAYPFDGAGLHILPTGSAFREPLQTIKHIEEFPLHIVAVLPGAWDFIYWDSHRFVRPIAVAGFWAIVAFAINAVRRNLARQERSEATLDSST